MNRRGFLKFLAAIPVIRHVPFPKKIFGSGMDGDLVLIDKTMVSPYQWGVLVKGGAGGAGGGGGGGVFVYFRNAKGVTITANGGNGGNLERHA